MRLRPTPPVIPPDLLDRYGEPEYVFGPNMRFRLASVLLGALLLLLGLVFFLFGVVARAAQPPARSWEGILVPLAAGLMAVGAAAVVFARSVPLNWVCVCPGGLLRTRAANWDAVSWSDVSRFEDANLSRGAVTIRQCRIVTSAGAEWGFLADQVAGYGRLTAVLRRKLEERPTPSDPNR